MISGEPDRPEYRPAPVPSGYWPEAGQAMGHLTRVQRLLDARGLTGAERKLKPLMRRAAAAFKAQDLARVAAACDAVFEAVDGLEQK